MILAMPYLASSLRNSMRHVLPSFALVLALGPALPGQDILYYRFDDNYGTKAINYAPASPAPAEGTILSTLPNAPQSSWAPGRFGSSLAGSMTTPFAYNRVDTGWVPNTYSTSFSYAMWLKLAYNQSSSTVCYLCGCNVSYSFRVHTSGTAGVFYTSGIAPSTPSVANIYALATQAWVHVACVVDATMMNLTYYINGQAEAGKALTSVTWSSNVAFTVGQQLTGSPGSIFDIDEFLFTQRVLTPAQVAVLAGSPRAGDGPYAGGCGNLTLGGAGGLPAIGNSAYGLTLNSATPLSFAIGIGSNRKSISGVPLPFDLGTLIGGIGTCMIDSSIDLGSIAGAKPQGPATVPFPIPANVALGGLTLFLQTPAVGGAQPLVVSNPLSVGIGN